jgi:hypothetical protein
MKLVIFSALIAGVILPASLGIFSYTVLFAALLVLTAAAIGSVESLMARLRMSHVPQFIFFRIAISLFMSIITVIFGGGNY